MNENRLGLNVHRDQWPAPAGLKALEAGGFGYVQVHAPPISMLCDPEHTRRHARALRATLATTGLRLIIHGPDTLSAGEPVHDRAFAGLIEHAAEAGAELVVYHGAHFPLGTPPLRLAAEEESLRRLAAIAQQRRVLIAIENLAPVYPGRPHICHDALAVRDLVRALDSPAVGMLFDVGHAHITATMRGSDIAATLEAVASDVVLFHVHDNLGDRSIDVDRPGVNPLKLDLHLPPGAGSLPWERVAPALRMHGAPLMLEVERSHVHDPAALAAATRDLLRRGVRAAA